MSNLCVFVTVVAFAIMAYIGQKTYTHWMENERKNSLMDNFNTMDEIQEHAKEFATKEIIKVNDHVFVAINYALANSIMIDGPDGLIIVDVTESYQSGLEILGAFRKFTQKPIKALIYTHSHMDHINGAKAFVEDENSPPDVWAHHSIDDGFRALFSGPSQMHYTRAMRQFGVFLPQLSAGIGLKLNVGKDGAIGTPLYPNRFLEGSEKDVSIAGLNMRLVHIPGETNDQLGIWLPEWKMFLCADDVYKAFPNLYAIRGTQSRDLRKWVSSLDKIISLYPEMLVPSHTRPVFGRETIRELLITYRDAIQYIHDQTVRFTDTGKHPDEITKLVKLPENLERHPYLKQFYGTTEWSVKGVFDHYLGWFSGDPVDLSPLTRVEKAERMVNLVGVDKLINEAKNALLKQDYQWALELSSYVLIMNNYDTKARDIKVEALIALGGKQTSLNGRNYYLTSALEEVTELDYKLPIEYKTSYIYCWPLEWLMSTLPTRFRPEDCGNINETVLFEFREPDSNISVQIRNSVAIVRFTVTESWNVKVSVTERVWRDIAAKRRSTIAAVATGDMTIDGGLLALHSFMKCFDKD